MTSAQTAEMLVKHYIILAIIPSLFLFFEGMVQRNPFVFAYYFKFIRRPLVFLKYITFEEKIYIPSKTICVSKSLAELQALLTRLHGLDQLVRSISKTN